MSRIRNIVLFALAVFVSSFTTSPGRAADETISNGEREVGKVELSSGDTIVFLGDSITHQCLYTQYVEDFFYTRYPHIRLRFHNAGVGGAKAWDALERFDRDVAQYKPKYVTILLGMNDGAYRPFDRQTFETYRHDMTELLGRIKESGAAAVPMTPTMYDEKAARMRDPNRNRAEATLREYNAVLAYYGTWLRGVAARDGAAFVDMYSPLNNLTAEKRRTEPDWTMIKDAVHPDAPGQLVMAYAVIDDLGLRKGLSNIRIVPGRNDKLAARASGGKVGDLEQTDDGVAFTWTAQGLPWVLPAEAQEGAKLLKLGHKASREGLEVHGLKAGRYELTIDEKPVGVYTHVAFSRHIELQENEKTPEHQQALEVAELNKKRNAGPVRSLRNEWSQFQRHSRVAQALKAYEESENRDPRMLEELQKQVAATAKKIEGMEERIKKHEAAAREIEDEIFKINQPQPRRYRLQRVNAEKSANTGS